MYNNNTIPRIPHTLRFVILLLRLTLGLDFFYLGWSMLFDPTLGHALGARSFGALYAWIAGAVSPAWFQPFSAWAFMIIGGCLVAGLFTRVASVLAIALTFLSYSPSVNFGAFAVTQLVSDSVLVILCLFVVIFSGAGEYFGVDRFIHVRLGRGQKK